MERDPHHDEWPPMLTDDEQKLASALIGEAVLRVEYDADGDWEASYLRLSNKTVALAAVCVEGRFDAHEWPWRLAFIEVPDPTHPTNVEVDSPGRVEGIDFYEQDGIEAGIALRCSDEVVWFRCAGGDYVKALAGQRPADFAALRLVRRLPH